ncbi:MAG: D-arabinose 5-phosphate isomerase GutQ [Methanophagales archaeon]|nr:hypothetical protein [Methanophagales archaeon]MCU4139753.1 D-arabinose 5-phosphate isomerase GutQ [Methanophagales archaeon]
MGVGRGERRGFRYISRVVENVKRVRESDLRAIYEDLSEADCIILVGEGRSQGALFIGMGQINKTVRTVEDIDFPGRNILDAAPKLERMHGKIVVLVNSGSGETPIPKIVAQQLAEYIEKTHSEKFKIDAIVSNPKSSVGEIAKSFGSVVVLAGRDGESGKRKRSGSGEDSTRNSTADAGVARVAREKGDAREDGKKGEEKEDEEEEEADILESGIMNDIYELGSLLILQKIKECINEGEGFECLTAAINEEARAIREVVSDFIRCELYGDIIDELERRNRIIIGGFGPARHVAMMTAIRLQHVKRAIGDDAYLAGPFAPRPRAGDILFLISWSGETLPLLEWCRKHKEIGGSVYSIVGNYSTLAEQSKSFRLNAPVSVFYERATFALSPLPLHLVERLRERGFELPEYIMRWFHSIMQ